MYFILSTDNKDNKNSDVIRYVKEVPIEKALETIKQEKLVVASSRPCVKLLNLVLFSHSMLIIVEDL